MTDLLASGDYARKQIYCPSAIVAWSHRSRFRLACGLAANARGGRLLDYGCGDGTFIALTQGMFAESVGADIDEAQLAECRRRFAGITGVQFVQTSAVRAHHAGGYDVITCMEVLEHCPDNERVRVLDELRTLAGSGQVIISVPIEIGPALPAKQLFRAIAAWRRHGDYQYRETYSIRELLRAALARPCLARAEYTVATPAGPLHYCGHKGFDWRILQEEIRARFVIESRRFTPIRLLGAVLNSQVWFVCRPR